MNKNVLWFITYFELDYKSRSIFVWWGSLLELHKYVMCEGGKLCSNNCCIFRSRSTQMHLWDSNDHLQECKRKTGFMMDENLLIWLVHNSYQAKRSETFSESVQSSDTIHHTLSLQCLNTRDIKLSISRKEERPFGPSCWIWMKRH